LTSSQQKFGALVRQERMAKKIGLREMAKMIDVSPTYLSKVELDQFSPPAEDKVRKIAKCLDHDVDELLAKANRVSSDITDIIKNNASEVAAGLRHWNIYSKTAPGRMSKSCNVSEYLDFAGRHREKQLATPPNPSTFLPDVEWAGILEWLNNDSLLTDLSDIVKKRPGELAAMLRAAKNLSPEAWIELQTWMSRHSE
jgi:transcriptional regulator with XRE-family HTH domain